jgi:DNA-binding NtrC family response regulator
MRGTLAASISQKQSLFYKSSHSLQPIWFTITIHAASEPTPIGSNMLEIRVVASWLERKRLPESPRSSMVDKGFLRLDADREREIIEAALAETGGRIAGPSGAAAKLGIPRQTLDSKISILGIKKNRFKSA